MAEINPNSVAECLRSDTPCLSTLKVEIGEIGTRAVLTMLITDTVKFFNVGKTMAPEQVAQTADLIIEDFPFIKPDDLKLCFKKAKKGHYNNGQMYDRIDGQIIFNWLSEYVSNRGDVAENESISKYAEHKKIERTEQITPAGKAMLKQLKDNFTAFLKEGEDEKKEKKLIDELISKAAVLMIEDLEQIIKQYPEGSEPSRLANAELSKRNLL